MSRISPIGLLVLLLAAAGTARSQPASAPSPAVVSPSTTVGEVVIQAPPSSKHPERLPGIVWKDVTARAQPSHTGNLSRWMEAVCPGVVGLTPSYASFVAKRIVEVAHDFAPDRPKCGRGINILVAFTPTPQALMDDVRERHPMLLGYHYLMQKKTLATFQSPIEAWYVTATNGKIDTPYGRGPSGTASGRIRNGMANAIWFALIVVDAKAIQDQPIGAVADHIAALTLSKTGPRTGCSPFPSILDSMDPACPTSASLMTLTAYDRSLLKGLYASDPEDVGQAERGSIMLHVVRDMHAPQPSADAGSKTK